MGTSEDAATPGWRRFETEPQAGWAWALSRIAFGCCNCKSLGIGRKIGSNTKE